MCHSYLDYIKVEVGDLEKNDMMFISEIYFCTSSLNTQTKFKIFAFAFSPPI